MPGMLNDLQWVGEPHLLNKRGMICEVLIVFLYIHVHENLLI